MVFSSSYGTAVKTENPALNEIHTSSATSTSWRRVQKILQAVGLRFPVANAAQEEERGE